MDLTALQHSPFLQSLGWAIANSLWQAAALWVAYLLISGTYKGASAKFKNNLSTILLSASFIWFCITFFFKYFTIENSGTYTVQFYETNNISATYNWDQFLNKLAAGLPYLSSAYLLLLVFLSFRLINVYSFTRFIKSNGIQKPGTEWKLFTEKVALHMGITRKIKLWVSHHIDVPATIGFIKPVILIPLASVNRLSADQLEAIILHELSHIKRNDYLINLFISIIETILFFNPFVVLLARIIKRERENCCDDFVIQYQYDRHAYASALLSLEQFRNVNLRLAIGATSGKKQLLLRVKRIMEINSNANFNYGQKLAALLLITGVICSVAWLSPQGNESKKLQANKSPDILNNKIREEKPETFFLNTGTDKIKTIAVKPQIKKLSNKAERELKELRALNLMAIAEQDYRRERLLLEESKKQITRKKIRFNVNRFFPQGSTFAAYFNNPVMTGYMPVFPANEEFNRQRIHSTVDLQKLQAEMEKAQFSFSFDWDKMQEAVKLAFGSKQLMPLMRLQNIKETKTEKNKTDVESSGGTSSKRTLRFVTTITGAHGGPFFYIDSLSAAELKAVCNAKQISGKRFTTSVSREERTNTPDDAYAYEYGENGYGIAMADKKNSEKILKKTIIVDGKAVTAVISVLSGTTYRRIPAGNTPAKIYVPGSIIKATRDKVSVEFKKGILYINGEKINLPDTDELLAQISLKAKKISSKVKDIDININD